MGFGTHASGAEAAEYYASYGNEVHIYESRPRDTFGGMPQRLESMGVNLHFEDLDPKEVSTYDLVVKTPATPLHLPTLRRAKEITNDFAALLKNPAVDHMTKIVVVGNKGKTLVASAIVHALNMLGCRAQMCGVIGMSGYHILKDISEKGDDVYTHLVLEMAAWQITDTAYSLYNRWPKLDVVLMTSKVDAQKLDKKEYYRVFGPWVEKAVIDRDSRNVFLAETGMNKKKVVLSPTTFNPERGVVPLEAAFDVLKSLGYHKKDIEKALSSYKGIPHRMEQIGFRNGILYVNDSAATIPESVAYSFKTMGQASIHLILGGTERGTTDASGLRIPVKMASSVVLLSGTFTEKLIPQLEKWKVPYSGPYESMEDAVKKAKENADNFISNLNSNTQIVLLSPGASGYEYFQNEFNRGNIFRDVVKALIAAKQ